MEVSVSPSIESNVLCQLQALNRRANAIEPIILDYQVVLTRATELDVRVGQLNREANVLRDEVAEKERKLHDLAAREAKVEAAEKLQEQLAKAKADAVHQKQHHEELKEIFESLGVKHSKLTEDNTQLQSDHTTALAKIAELETELAKERGGREAAVTEWELCKAESDKNEQEKMEWQQKFNSLEVQLLEENHKITQKLDEINDLEEKVQNKEKDVDLMQARIESEKKIWVDQMLAGRPFKGFLGGWGAAKKPKGELAQKLLAAVQFMEQNKIRQVESLLQDVLKALTFDGDFVNVTSEDCKEAASLESSSTPPEMPEMDFKVPTKDYPATFLHQGGCTGVAFQPNGNVVVTGGLDKKIRVWDSATRVSLKTLTGMVRGVTDVGFDCNGERVVAGSSDGAVRVWNWRRSDPQTILNGHFRPVTCVATSFRDPSTAASCGEDGKIILWDLQSGTQKGQHQPEEGTNVICYTKEGHLVSGHSKGSLCIWDVRHSYPWTLSSQSKDSVTHQGLITAVLPLPSSSMVLTASSDNVLRMYDFRRDQKVVRSFRSLGFSLGTMGFRGRCVLTCSRDEKYFVAGSADRGVVVYDREGDGKSIHSNLRCDAHKEPVVACAWHGSENCIVSCDKGGKVVFWKD